MSEEVVVLHSGFITKRGHLRKNWKRRYFSLNRSGLLEYFDGRRCKGRVPLSLSCVVKKKTECSPTVLWPSAATDDNAFAIDSNLKSIFLVFDSVEECWHWLEALKPFVTLGTAFQEALNKARQTENGDNHFLSSEGSTEEEEVVKYLRSLSVKIPRTTVEELAGTHAVERVVSNMNQYPLYDKVQATGCKCLFRLASKSQRLLKHCVKHNALPVAKDAMSAHYANEEIQLSGIQLIQCYLEKDDPQIHNQVLDEDYVRRICQALKVLGRQKAVVEAALSCLWLMATTCPHEWSCPSFINAGTFPILIDVISNDCPVYGIVESAFCIVTAMMHYDSMPEVFVHCGGLHALLSVLQTYAKQSSTVIQSLLLVLHLVSNSEKARDSLLEQDIIRHLLLFLKSSELALQSQVSEVQSAALAVLSTIAAQDLSLLAEFNNEIISACIGVIQTSGDDNLVLEASLQFLQFALQSGAVEGSQVAEVISFLLGFLLSHNRNEAIMLYTITGLSRLLMTDQNEMDSTLLKLVEREGCIECLCSAMKRFAQSAGIQSFGCLILCEAVGFAHQRIVKCGSFDILSNALKSHPRLKSVVCAAMVCLECLLTTTNNDESLVLFSNSGCFSAMVTTMQRWSKSETVQTSGLRILTYLANNDCSIRQAIAVNGYLALVTASMRYHLGVVRVQTEACCCLNAFATYDLAVFIHQSEACYCILDAMKIEGHQNNERLQYNCLSVLSILLSFLEDWTIVLESELCVDTILSVFAHFKDNESFQLPAFAALLAIGKTSNILREKIVASEVGVQQLCGASANAECNEALQLRAIELLSCLTSV